MLEDDVASNKAIGTHGAIFIQNQLKDSDRLSVLTHCNTGRSVSHHECVSSQSFLPKQISFLINKENVRNCFEVPIYGMFCFGSLATAGYGTALGVIRALHTEGVLNRAYCTETRPFNQVSIQFDYFIFSKPML